MASAGLAHPSLPLPDFFQISVTKVVDPRRGVAPRGGGAPQTPWDQGGLVEVRLRQGAPDADPLYHCHRPLQTGIPPHSLATVHRPRVLRPYPRGRRLWIGLYVRRILAIVEFLILEEIPPTSPSGS